MENVSIFTQRVLHLFKLHFFMKQNKECIVTPITQSVTDLWLKKNRLYSGLYCGLDGFDAACSPRTRCSGLRFTEQQG